MSNQKEAMNNDKNAGFAILFWIVVFFLGCYLVAGDIEPIPIEEKPKLTENIREWYFDGKLMSRERKVVMPDGSTCWIKNTDKIAPTDKQWQVKADDLWSKTKPDPNEIKICPYCGQPLPEGFVP